jgi:hypothetical protein
MAAAVRRGRFEDKTYHTCIICTYVSRVHCSGKVVESVPHGTDVLLVTINR